jgi:hypothetical protein
MLLAINLTIKKMRLSEYIRLLKLTYIITGSISGFFEKKVLVLIFIPIFNDIFIKIAREYDTAIIRINQAKQ